jgi:hypothetical protein
LIEIPINDRDRAIGIGIVIGKYRDDDNPEREFLPKFLPSQVLGLIYSL